MRMVRKFEEFTKEGIVKKQAPDKARAEFLIEESEQNYIFLQELLKKFEVDDRNANSFIKQSYDIIMELIRAEMILHGYNASGHGAHEAEVSYMRLMGFSENDLQFADQLRYFRNGMLYYGTMLDKEYAEKVIGFLERIKKKLSKAKILFVCRGNVSRSQIAKAFYEKYSGKKADSAGIEVSKIGEKLKDKESAKDIILAMKEDGINISENTRTKLTPEMIDKYDKIVVLAEKSVVPDYLRNSKKAIFFDIEDTKNKDLETQKRLILEIKKLVLELVR